MYASSRAKRIYKNLLFACIVYGLYGVFFAIVAVLSKDLCPSYPLVEFGSANGSVSFFGKPEKGRYNAALVSRDVSYF